MKLTFLGGAYEVGRSSILLETEKTSVLTDYGIKFKEKDIEFPEFPKKVDALLLSHAHLDHSGAIPRIFKRMKFPVYGTDLTFKLSNILQHDNVKVCKENNQILGYSNRDIDILQESQISLNYSDVRKVHDDVLFSLSDAGHIPGSASILLEVERKRILYTGDIKLEDTRLLTGAKIPSADILIIESTYGNRDHPDRKTTEEQFIAEVESTIDRGGIALVPVFTVGRSQEVLMILKEIDADIYLDGLARDVTMIMLENQRYIKNPKALTEAANNVNWIEHNRERDEICQKPCAIVTTSGMLQGGPVLRYLKRVSKDSRSSVLLTGYQVKGTNGRRLLEENYFIDNNKKFRVSLNVKQFDFSAHADKSELKKIVKDVNPEKVVIVHGDPECSEALGKELESEYKVYIPKIGDVIVVD